MAIVGAGPAGMTAAFELSKRGVEVDVYEAGAHEGGLSRSIDLWGQRVDLGPHRFFSQDARVNRVWLEAVAERYAMVDRLTRIYYRQKYFHYPLRAADALRQLGGVEAARCVASYAVERGRALRHRPDAETFEDWVVSRFGRRLFEIFFKSYSEKLWGIPCSELDADFAAQRIKKLSLLEAAKNALGAGRTTHATLVDRFAYPLEGAGSVYAGMADAVRRRGGRIHFNAPVRHAVREGGRVVGVALESGEVRRVDHVVSTMPLTLLVRSLEGTPDAVHAAASSLTFRNTVLVYLRVDAERLFPDQWLYIHSPDLMAGRVTNFRNWVPDIVRGERSTILALEYWCNDADALWREDDATLITRARRELARTGLAAEALVGAGHVVRIPRCYPVYRRGYRTALDTVVAYLRGVDGLTPIGRYGAFKYNNQDHSILMGLLAARNIADGEHNDLWSVNTDYESYQEAAVITATGLEPAKGPDPG